MADMRLRPFLSSFPRTMLLHFVAMVLAIAGGLSSAGFGSNEAENSESPEFFKNENGTVYDRAVVDLGATRKVVLPRDAIVRRTAQTGKLQLFMAKRLSFNGFPPEPMTRRGVRKYMGCAVKNESGTLVVATHGEWHSHIEGLADMRLVAIVPKAVQCEHRTGLSGPDRVATERKRDFAGGHDQDGYWYTSASLAKGWTAVTDIPDPDRTAK